MKLSELTADQIVEIYNASELCTSVCTVDHLEIDRNSYGTIEVHLAGCDDDMVLTIDEQGALYLMCLDNRETYHEVLPTLKKLKQMGVEPWA